MGNMEEWDMQSKRDGLIPIGEALADLGGPVQAIRKTLPPARRGFTVADQVNQLVTASEADPRSRLHGADDGAVLLPRTIPATGFSTSAPTAPTSSS